MKKYIRIIKKILVEFIIQISDEIEKERITDYINDFYYNKVNKYYRF